MHGTLDNAAFVVAIVFAGILILVATAGFLVSLLGRFAWFLIEDLIVQLKRHPHWCWLLGKICLRPSNVPKR